MNTTGQGRGRRRLVEVGRVSDVPQDAWDALVGGESPFLEWAWLSALEDSGSISPEHGWTPRHLTLWDDDRLVAACPVYEKAHSHGEFVFDHGWARAAIRAGIPYYPKLLVAVPATPITGARILAAPGEREAAVAAFAGELERRCAAGRFSSAHVDFCRPAEVAELRARGWIHRRGVQYHWSNRGFATFDDYLESLRSKRRNQVRRERREVAAAGIDVQAVPGTELPNEVFGQLFELYRRTVDRNPWGQRYVNRRFFELVRERFRPRLSFVLARADGRVIGGAFNVEKGDTLYGRYWAGPPDVRYLHFEVCYYAGIEHCIRRGLQRFEPGAGGEFKALRGFEATETDSMHWIEEPRLRAAVADFCERERRVVADEVEWFALRSALRRDGGERA